MDQRNLIFVCAAVLAAAGGVQFCETLPAVDWPVTVVLAVLGIACVNRRPVPACVILAAASALWFADAANQRLAARLPESLQGKNIQLSLQIIDFVNFKEGRIQFVAGGVLDNGQPLTMRLNWYDSDFQPQLGDRWLLQVRLRRPRTLSNQGGFDFERLALRKGYDAVGYVRSHPDNRRLTSGVQQWHSRLRLAVRERLTRALPDGRSTAVLRAISVGDRSALRRQDWDLFAATGTSHLMAISGLHVGLAVWFLLVPLRSAITLLSGKANARRLALLPALVAACVYAWLSGGAVPALRATAMLLLAGSCSLALRRTQPVRVFCLALLVLFIAQPLVLLAPGFMLSFAAVAVLLCAAARINAAVGGAGAVRILQTFRSVLFVQFLLFFGLLPLTLFLFDRIAWPAPLVNLLALPLFSILVLPLTLSGLLLPGVVGDSLLIGAWLATELLLGMLLSAEALLTWQPAIRVDEWQAVWLSLPAIVFVLLPKACPGRTIAPLAVIAVIIHQPPKLPRGCFDIEVFDVGQGLAVGIRTRSSTLLFDTGPAWRGQSTAERVLPAWVRRHGIDRIDTLVVSHADLDHRGGADWVRDNSDVVRELAGEPQDTAAVACSSEQFWRHDGVDFEILYPRHLRASGNNASCVLSVRAGPHAVLLTGDIEAPAERQLIRDGRLSRYDTVVVPHHGSKTSSSMKFVQLVAPRLAIVSAAWGNRWGLPRPEVTERWRSVGAQVITTAEAGAIGALFCARSPIPQPRRARVTQLRYWHERP